MNFKQYSYSFFILTLSFDSSGMTVGCNPPKIIDEFVSNEFFKLERAGENSHDVDFEVEIASEIDGVSLNELVLFKKVEGKAEYFFYLKTLEQEKKSITGFTLSKKNIEGAELMALYQNKNQLCTTEVRKHRTKI